MRNVSFGEKNRAWFDNILFYLRSRHIIKKIKKIPGHLSIIDIGCGYNPKLLVKISQVASFKKAFGIDLSINNNFSNKKIKLIESSMEKKLPLQDSSFNIVLSTAVIEHLNNYELALKEIYRILKSGGYLFLTTPSPQAKPILEFLAFKLKIIDDLEIKDHKRYFSSQQLKNILSQIGYKKIIIKKLQMGLNNLFICQK
ncbi:class I SAM-dependent methyltransferase [Candidatus Parcubacteria bacterium]|nr:class I SAM-dependent methyltransferase [Candidatus Parcubacteria bacterium]